jgi:hypothetical protein
MAFHPKRTSKNKLPAALAKRALAKAEAAEKRLLRQALDDISLIRRKQRDIADAFFEIGEALARLRKDPIPKLLHRSGFGELCEVDLEISVERAGLLIEIAERVRREDAVRWKQEKTVALLALANATPEHDTPGMLAVEKLRTPDHRPFDPEKTSARRIKEFAKVLRADRGTGSVRGRTTTVEERKLARALLRELHAQGLDESSVAAVATKPGAISKLRIELPIDRLSTLRVAIGKVAKTTAIPRT